MATVKANACILGLWNFKVAWLKDKVEDTLVAKLPLQMFTTLSKSCAPFLRNLDTIWPQSASQVNLF